MALTVGEAVQVVGRATVNIGLKLDDPETPKKITKAELMEIIQTAAADALKEFAD